MDKVNVAELRKRRGRLPVLIPEAGATGMVAVIRSLGRAGYPVHACSADPTAIGLQSRMVYRPAVHPRYTDPAFLPWLREYIQRYAIQAIVPSEGFYLAIRSAYPEFSSILAVSCEENIVYRCLSKADVFEAFMEAGNSNSVSKAIPRSLVFSEFVSPNLLKSLSLLPYPVYIKTDACQSRYEEDGTVEKAEDFDMAKASIDRLLKRFDKVLVQEQISGRKATVNICSVGGEVLAESMCLAIHESPHTGGLTAYRHTWWHQEMRDDAYERVRFLGWDGVSMMEYKWDEACASYRFIEMNARYWAALHLDLFAGRDFPRIQLDALFGLRYDRAMGPQTMVFCRNTVPADFGYAASRARDSNVPALRRLWALIEFVLISFSPRIRSDFFFPGDRVLYFRQWKKFFAGLFT